MININSLTAKLLTAMFPGSAERGAPGFLGADLLQRLDARSPEIRAMEFLLMNATQTNWPTDVNLLLKSLKKTEPELVSTFIEQATMVYFSEPAVSRALTGKPSPLFPSATAMAEMDFDLLEPVLNTIKGMKHG